MHHVKRTYQNQKKRTTRVSHTLFAHAYTLLTLCITQKRRIESTGLQYSCQNSYSPSQACYSQYIMLFKMFNFFMELIFVLFHSKSISISMVLHVCLFMHLLRLFRFEFILVSSLLDLKRGTDGNWIKYPISIWYLLFLLTLSVCITVNQTATF